MSAEETGAAGHLDATVLADLAEGLLAPADAAAAEGHLAGCAACRDVHDQLDRVVSLLRDAREAGPMPADVAARLDAALAAEPARTRTAPAARAGSPAPALPTRGRRRLPQLHWPGPRLAAAAATAGVVALGSWVVINADPLTGGAPTAGEAASIAEDAPAFGRSESRDIPGDSSRSTGGAEFERANPAARTQSFSALDGRRLQRTVRALAAVGTLRGPDDTTAGQAERVLGEAAPPGCGADLASALGRQLLGVRAAGGAREYLVVTRGVQPGTVEGYVVSACDAGPPAASLRATVPVPQSTP